MIVILLIIIILILAPWLIPVAVAGIVAAFGFVSYLVVEYWSWIVGGIVALFVGAIVVGLVQGRSEVARSRSAAKLQTKDEYTIEKYMRDRDRDKAK